jgi:hypothetical protein
MDTIQLVKGDTGPELKAELKRTDTGDDFVADDATLNLHIRKKGETSVIVTIEANAAKSTPASGILVFSLEDFLTDSSVDEGFYEAEVEVALPNGSSMSAFDVINIKVRDDFA